MRILLADDNPDDREAISRLLSASGHEIRAVSDGQAALAAFGGDAAIDLVLSDISMPGMSGVELIERILKFSADTLCVMVSGRDDIASAVSSLRAGAFDFIRKPCLEQDLSETLERATNLLAERGPVQADFAVSENLRILLESRRAVIAPATQRIVSYCLPFLRGRRKHVDELRLALGEALMNAIVHGNLSVTSDAKNDGRWDDYEREIDEREALPQFARRPVEVDLRVEPGLISITVTDEGAGFDPKSLPDAADPTTMLSSGRGVLLIRNAMDEVRWNPKGTRIEMIRRIGVRRIGHEAHGSEAA